MQTLVKVAPKTAMKNPVSKNGRKTTKDNSPFKLDPEFIAKFTGKKPKFGYNGLGEFVFYRTYSRLKSDGKKETFVDMLQRVVEGCYEIQRRWCRCILQDQDKQRDIDSDGKNTDNIAFGGMGLPWTRAKAQKSAQEMFQRMWDFKFLPPGRGLWVMGTPHMWKVGSSALNNCFEGNTEIITRSGIKKIRDVAGTTQTLLVKGGKWVDAKVHSFGEQELTKITMHRGKHLKVVYATAQHRWFVKSKIRALVATAPSDNIKSAYKTRECYTEDLRPGMRLSACFGSGINNAMLRPSAVGIMHGICFGDGTTGSPNPNHGTYLYLCGKKDEELLRYFTACYQTPAPERGSEGAIRIADLPRAFRRKPDLNEATTYLYGWLAGYFAADGSVSKSGICHIDSAERDNLEVVRSVCAILGIGCHPICEGLQTVNHNGQIKKFVSYRITLFADHLTDEFFLISEHKRRYIEYSETRGSKRGSTPAHMYWYVDSVENTGERQEVFCPTVPDYACFTLADNILTGNCGFCSTQDIAEDPAWQFCFVMDMSMLGVGVGFDTRGANKVTVVKPHDLETEWVIEDSREGWVDSLRALIESFTVRPELGTVRFDYSLIRPAGSTIKGFGGKASGPDTLKDLHRMVAKQFHNILRRKSQLITSVDIVDFMNFIGRCVVAGNVRRSSEIALGDPADWDYMQMKDKTLFSEQLNSHRWASNNSIFAKVGMDYRRVAEQIAGNGEPGCLWLDNVQNYGRAIDGRQEGIDKRAIGTNPCFAGNMRLMTAEGYVPLMDLWCSGRQQEYYNLGKNPLEIYGEIQVVNRNGLVPATNVYRTGMGVDLFRVGFSDGSSIDATATHEFITLTRQRLRKKMRYDEQRTFLRDLKVGDMIPLNHTVHFGTFHDPAYGELAGWTIGDGSLSPQQDGQLRGKCTCYEDDINTVLPRLRGLMFELYVAHNKSTNQSPVYAGWHREQEHFDHEEETIGSNVLGRMLRADGIDVGAKHIVPCSIWRGTRETIAAFLRGLASADGYVQVADNGTISARIWQSNQPFLLECRLLLSQFGIASSVKFRKEAGQKLMNDGKGGKKLYDCKAGYELIISGHKQVSAFLDQIGFIQSEKMTEARKWLLEHRGSNNSDTGRYTYVKSIEPIGKGDTYCLTEPGDHQIVVEGCQVGQCGEQSLEDAELCCLCETFPAHHEDAADYHRTLKFAYLYAKTVTLLPTHCKKTNSVLLRNRRIGLSQSGIIQAFAKFGRRQVLEDFCNKGYEVVRHWDEIYSEWLCVSKSLKCTSVKPSGSVSLLAGATAGIHFTIAPTRSYWRNVRVASDSALIKALLEAGYHVEKAVTDDKTSVVRFGVSEPNVPSVSEISIWQQTKNAVDYQKYWADNQVSCTIQFKPEEAKDIPFVLESFDDELKGISFLPIEDNGYPQQPYQPATPEEVAAYNAKLKPLNFDKDLMEDAVGTKFCDGDSCQI